MAEKIPQADNSGTRPISQRRIRAPRLIVLEGIDLSGRTTQVQLLNDWLTSERYHVTVTAWRTSPLIGDILARARSGPPLRPITYSLLYCADHLDRTQRVIKPALEKGEIVLADRYIYTAFARDAARGLDPVWVRNLYRFAVQPDCVFYLHISPEEAVKRRLVLQAARQEALAHSRELAATGKKKSKKDQPPVQEQTVAAPSFSKETLNSFRNFENRMYSEYQEMQKEFGFTVIEGSQSIDKVQAILRQAISGLLQSVQNV